MRHFIRRRTRMISTIISAITNIIPKLRTKFADPSYLSAALCYSSSVIEELFSVSASAYNILLSFDTSQSSHSESSSSSSPKAPEMKSVTPSVFKNSIKAKLFSILRNISPLFGKLKRHCEMKKLNCKMLTVFHRYFKP